jgi:hypothetical protein
MTAIKPKSRPPPPTWPVYDMGLPLVDLTLARALADELDDQDHVRRMVALDREWNSAQANDGVGR